MWALPWDISSRDKIEQLISDAVENNQTEILAEVRYRADAMYIPNKTDSTYYNPEQRSYILPDNDFDPLAYLLETAHEQGLQVQAWVSTLNATPTNSTYLRSNYIYQQHSDWIMTDANGNKMRASEYMGYFVDPGIPDVKYHLMNVVLDIVSNYPELDGIHLDYIRYPARQYGYATESVERYRNLSKLHEIAWNDWRISQITDFVRDLREMAMVINPKLLITAAVIADIDEAKNDYAQDWVNWINSGIVDRVYPMAYSKGYDRFYGIVADIAEQTPQENVIVGLRAWQERGESVYRVEQIIEKAELCRQLGFGGIALFSYEGIRRLNYFPGLKLALFDKTEPDTLEASEEDFIAALINSSVHERASETTSVDLAVLNEKVSSCESISLNQNTYSLSFYIDEANFWSWSIIDVNSNVIYEQKKAYHRGYFVEEWNGIANDGGAIQPGVYTLRLCNDKDMLSSEKKFIVF